MGALANAGAFLRTRSAATLLALSAVGAGAIVVHEGMQKVAYRDPVGIVTVCAGHTKTAKLGQVKTDAQCAELLRQDTAEAQEVVRSLVKVKLTQAQFDALVSFVFNVGSTNFRSSTLLKRINAGKCWDAGAEFSKWVYAKGTKLPGLVTRRADERQKFETGCTTASDVKRATASNANQSPSGVLVGQAEQGSIQFLAAKAAVADRRYTQRA